MGQVTALGQVKAHKGISGLQAGHDDRHIGLGAGMRLHVGPLCPIDFLDPVDGQLFDLVHHLATAVIALAGIALRILVGTYRAHGLPHILTDIVLRSNEFETG